MYRLGMAKKTETVSRGRLFALAAAAQADPRTVAKVLAGKPVKGGALADRIRAAIKAERS